MNIALWVVTVVLALVFLAAGAMDALLQALPKRLAQLALEDLAGGALRELFADID